MAHKPTQEEIKEYIAKHKFRLGITLTPETQCMMGAEVDGCNLKSLESADDYTLVVLYQMAASLQGALFTQLFMRDLVPDKVKKDMPPHAGEA